MSTFQPIITLSYNPHLIVLVGVIVVVVVVPVVLVHGHVGLAIGVLAAAAAFSMNEWKTAFEWASLSLLPSFLLR